MSQKTRRDVANSRTVGFQGGISYRAVDNNPGYARDLKNMFVRHDGSVQRRAGTSVIYDNENDDYDFIYSASYIVNSEPFTFYIDSITGKIYASNDNWTERLFEVGRETFIDSRKAIAFTRGERFFSGVIANYIYFINNYGDCFRINSKGIVKIAKEATLATVDNTDDINDVRDGIAGILYLDIVDATNRQPPDFFLPDNQKKTGPPFNGNLRVASVNEAGVISKLSEEYSTLEDKYKYISMIKEFRPEFIETVTIPVSDSNTYIERNVSGGVEQFNVLEWSGLTSLPVTSTVNVDIINFISSLGVNDLTPGFYIYTTAYTLNLEANANSGFIRLVINGTEVFTYITNVSASGNLWRLESNKQLSQAMSDYIDQQTTPGALFYYGNTATATLDINANAAGALTLPAYYSRYEPFSTASNPVAILSSRGLDHWQYVDELKLNSLNPNDGEFVYTEGTDIMYDYDDYTDWLSNMSQIAVWNENKIIAKTQKGLRTNTFTNGPIYDQQINLPTYDNSFGTYVFNLYYSPITSLEGSSFRSFVYDAPAIDEIITAPKDIVFNREFIFVLQDNKVWYGGLDLKLTNFIDMNETVNFIEPLFDGVLAFCDKVIYRVTTSRKDRLKDLNVKAAKAAHGGIYFIDTDNNVWLAFVNYSASGQPYVDFSKISEAIENVDFGLTPKIAFINDELYIANDTEIFIFREGAWIGRYTFDGSNITDIINSSDSVIISVEDE